MSGGFTLLELLVVIGVVALLMSVLLPVLGRSRDAARAAVCGGQVRQMVLAQQGYFHDNDHRFFPEFEDRPTGRAWWFGFEAAGGPSAEGRRLLDRTRGRLYPYYGVSDSIEVCPAYPDDHPRYKPKFTTHWTTYAPSVLLINPTQRHRLDDVKRPSETLAFTDASQRNAFQPPASPGRPMFEQWHYIRATAQSVLYHHARRANASRLDGSVTALEADRALDERIVGVPLGYPPGSLRLVP